MSHLSVGLRRALHRPQLIVGLWLLSLLVAVLAALPAGWILLEALGIHPAAERLARGEADVMWIELLSSDSAGGGFFAQLLVGLLVSSLLYWLVSLLLSGGVVAAMLRPGHPAHAPPGRLLARATETAGAMLRLELLGCFMLRLPTLVLVVVCGYLLTHKVPLFELTASVLLLRLAPLLFLAFWLWSAGSVTLYYARLHRLTQPAGSASAGALPSLLAALGLALEPRKALGATLLLGLVSVLGYLALLCCGRLAAGRLDYALWIGLAFAVRALVGLGRSLLGLSVIAAAAEVWHHHTQ